MQTWLACQQNAWKRNSLNSAVIDTVPTFSPIKAIALRRYFAAVMMKTNVPRYEAITYFTERFVARVTTHPSLDIGRWSPFVDRSQTPCVLLAGPALSIRCLTSPTRPRRREDWPGFSGGKTQAAWTEMWGAAMTFSVSYKEILIGVRAHPNAVWILITSAKTLLSNKLIFCASR